MKRPLRMGSIQQVCSPHHSFLSLNSVLRCEWRCANFSLSRLKSLVTIIILAALPTVCRADEVQISQQSWEIIEEHLVGLKSQLEQCFKTDLSEMESPSVVHYYQADSLGWHPQNRTIGCFQFTHSPSSPACSKGNALRHLNLLEMKRIMLFKTNFSRWTAFFSNFPKILSRFLSISSWLFISIPLLSLVPTNNLRHL